MEISTADAVMLGGVLISVGVQIATTKAHDARIRRLESGAGGMGKRIGDVETTVGILNDRIGPRRRLTAAVPIDPGESKGDDE